MACEILPGNIGTISGTRQMMKHVFLSSDPKMVRLVVVDYDIYNRVMRALHSKSLIGYFADLNKQVCWFQAPWHIYKAFAIATWKHFAAFIFADLWLDTYDSACP